MMNVITMQRHIFNANISMDISTMMKILTTQLGTSCSFDSPGLARNEPTPGQRSQGDSTPSVLRFFCEGMLIMRQFMGINQKKRNTDGVVPHKPYANPG